MKKILKNTKGITLIALVITIIVLLILAGVTIATLTGENGILSRAQDAKTDTEIGEEREKVELSATGAIAENNGGEITRTNLNKELTSYIGTEGTDYSLSESETAPFVVTYLDSKRSYLIDENGKVSNIEASDFEDIEIGDYINYPVYYDNASLGDIAFLNNNRWRVIEKVEENGENYVKIIPTGVPLSLNYNATGNALSNIWDYPYTFSNPTEYSSFSYKYIEECTFKDSSNNYMEYLYDLKNLFVNNVYTKKDENFNPCVEFLNKKDIESLLQTTITDTVSVADNDLLAIPMESGYANIIIQDNDTNEIWCIDTEGNFKALTDTGIYGILPVVTLKSNVMFSKSNEKINNDIVYDIFIDEGEEQYPENYVLYANFGTNAVKRNTRSYFKAITDVNVSTIQVIGQSGNEPTSFKYVCTKYNNLNIWDMNWVETSTGTQSYTINFFNENEEIIYTTTRTISITIR